MYCVGIVTDLTTSDMSCMVRLIQLECCLPTSKTVTQKTESHIHIKPSYCKQN